MGHLKRKLLISPAGYNLYTSILTVEVKKKLFRISIIKILSILPVGQSTLSNQLTISQKPFQLILWFCNGKVGRESVGDKTE